MAARLADVKFHVGDFQVFEELGRGAMGEVWAARHIASGTDVAMKLLSGSEYREDLARSLAREVRAMARLTHPQIVSVLGQGRVSADDAAAAPSRLVAGAPWFVMERMDAGSLRERMPRSWGSLRWVLTQLLAGLAHAHARGVTHRDLKPANVLFTADPAPRLAIADFGVAHIRDVRGRQSASLHQVMGTPVYMAPEQYSGRWRDFGPWTDLYALGCMVYEMVHGEVPFLADTMVGLAQLHFSHEPPERAALFEVPDGLGPWIRWLLAKEPQERPMDAAHAWAHLPPGVDELAELRGSLPLYDDGPQTLLLDTHRFDTTLLSAEVVEARPHGRPVPTFDPPPVPEHCPPTPRAGSARRKFVASLFELRPPPPSGRRRELNLLWGDLRTVSGGCARVRAISGSSEAAGELLMEQFGQLVREVGAALWLKCEGAREGEAALSFALSRLFGTDGLPEDAVEDQLRSSPHSATWPAALRTRLAAILGIGDAHSPTRSGTTAIGERRATLRETLRALASRRAVVVTLSDVAGRVNDLKIVEELIDGEELAAPLLFLVWSTAQVASKEKESLERLRDHPRGGSLELSDYAPDDCLAMVRAQLPLSTSASDSAKGARLGPSSMLQLFGHWVRTDALEWDDHGFRLGSAARIPTGVEQLSQWRLEEVAEHTTAIEIAAALGRTPALDEWRRVCEAAGIVDPLDALDALAERGMGSLTANHFVFRTVELRTAAIRRSKQAGRFVGTHSLIVDTLELPAARKVRHLLAAGRDAELLDLLGTIWVPAVLDELGSAEVVALGTAAAERLGVPRHDIRVARIRRHETRRMRAEGRLDDAVASAREVLAIAEAHGAWLLVADSFAKLGIIAQTRGDLDEAYELCSSALERLRPHRHEAVRTFALGMSVLGMVESDRGRAGEAHALLTEACNSLRAEGEMGALATALNCLGVVLVRAESYPEATEALAECVRICDEGGSRLIPGRSLNLLGDIARRTTGASAAAEYYQRAHRILRDISDDEAAYPQFNLATLALEEGASDIAEHRFARVHAVATRHGATRLRAFASAGVFASRVQGGASAPEEEWTEVCHAIARGMAGQELGEMLELAAKALEARGETALAAEVLDRALDNWTVLGRTARVAAVRQLLKLNSGGTE